MVHCTARLAGVFFLCIIFFSLQSVALDAGESIPPYTAQGCITGEVTATSAIIRVRLTANPERNPTSRFWKKGEFEWLPYSPDLPEEVPGREGWVRILLSEQPDMNLVSKTPWKQVTPERDFSAQFRLDQLKPSTHYFYKTEISADESHSRTRFSEVQSFTTAPAESVFAAVEFTIITGTAARSRDIFINGVPWGFKSFQAMKAIEPDFFIHTGDNVYYDNDPPFATEKELGRYQWHRMHSMPCVRDFFRTIPIYFIKDDHDYRWDDCFPQQPVPHPLRAGSSMITDELGRELFLEAVPMGDKTYRTFVWGRSVQIWLVEGRDYRSPNTMPDGPEKSIWGRQQKQWLKNGLIQSRCTFKLLVSPTPIIGPDRESKIDNHANPRGFKTEGREFLNWINESRIENFYIICGDRHWQFHSIDSTGVEELSCGCVSDTHAASNQPHWDKARQPYFRDGYGGFLHVKLCGTPEKPEVRFIFRDVDGIPVYVVTRQAVTKN
ncbi:alkaline phosphatase D family protein [candidate division KSB1 bacterium]|nr:alkaline phosphatase D family protein [candidate division KSB1 bacterium]